MSYSPAQDVVFVRIFYCSSQLLKTKMEIMSTSSPTPSASPFSFSERDQRPDQAARKCEACHAQNGAAVKFTGSEKSCQEEQCRQIPVIKPTNSRFLPCFMPAAQPAATAERKLMQELAYPMVESFAPSDAYRTAAQPRRARLQRHQTPTARIKKNKLI